MKECKDYSECVECIEYNDCEEKPQDKNLFWIFLTWIIFLITAIILITI